MDRDQSNAIIQEAAESINRMARGTLIPHISLADLLKTKYKTQSYYTMVNKLRSHLRVHYGVFLRTESKAGYQIVPCGDEMELCEGRAQRGIKLVVSGVKHMNDIRMENIPAEKRDITVTKANKYGNLIGMLRAGAKEALSVGK